VKFDHCRRTYTKLPSLISIRETSWAFCPIHLITGSWQNRQ